jgi:hypothetical protein
MARLITGYDFQPTEIPTRAHIFQMLTHMSVAAISPSLIGSTLTGMHFGDTGTTLPDEGWIWADTAGSLWVRTTNGSAKLWRAQGGWSTNRFPVLGSVDTIIPPTDPATSRAVLRNRVAHGGNETDTNESNVGWYETANLAVTPIGKCEDTAVSGLNIRWVIRGGAVWNMTAGAAMMPALVRRHTSAGQSTVECDALPMTNSQSQNNIYHGLSARGFSLTVPNTRTGWLYGFPLRVY